MDTPQNPEQKIEDLRRTKRFVIHPPIVGRFGATEITLFDFGERGIQAEHALPFKLGLTATLVFRIPDQTEALELPGTVVWSRLSKKPNAQGKYLYRSGIAVEEKTELMGEALTKLVARAIARPDNLSLDRKRDAVREKRKRLGGHASLRTLHRAPAAIPTDQVLLVHQARERLRTHPDEAVKWYNRAKFDLNEGERLPFREDILAVWEYLERSIDISIIARVFEEKL
jgi:hypothetical protein